jgi:hypothetical protein
MKVIKKIVNAIVYIVSIVLLAVLLTGIAITTVSLFIL